MNNKDIAKYFRKQESKKNESIEIEIINNWAITKSNLLVQNYVIAVYDFNVFSKSDLYIAKPRNCKQKNILNSILETFWLWEVKKIRDNYYYTWYTWDIKNWIYREELIESTKHFLI